VLDIQLRGYQTLKDDPRPLFAARAREYGRLCLELYPLLGVGIRRAPSSRVRRFLRDLRERVRDEFHISMKARLAEFVAPALAQYTDWKDRLVPNAQPRTEVHRYRFH
jgi:hypothetical protein